jgi:hypothetical protein
MRQSIEKVTPADIPTIMEIAMYFDSGSANLEHEVHCTFAFKLKGKLSPHDGHFPKNIFML